MEFNTKEEPCYQVSAVVIKNKKTLLFIFFFSPNGLSLFLISFIVDCVRTKQKTNFVN